MSDRTAIPWCDATWNPVVGCSKVSPGCSNCYAERMARRFAESWGIHEVVTSTGSGAISPLRRLNEPLCWRKPRRVFVCSTGDLFHEAVSDETLDRVLAVMALAQQHRFLCLTKRPERMLRYLDPRTDNREHAIGEQMRLMSDGRDPGLPELPLQNVELGVSCEDQERADERIPILLRAPVAKRFVSLEPLLGPVDINRQQCGPLGNWLEATCCRFDPPKGQSCTGLPGCNGTQLDWVIIGGESGPGARPCRVEWIRSIRDQCKAAGVPCFIKQLGARPVSDSDDDRRHCGSMNLPSPFRLVLRSRKGSNPSEWPEDLRVREWPEVGA